MILSAWVILYGINLIQDAADREFSPIIAQAAMNAGLLLLEALRRRFQQR